MRVSNAPSMALLDRNIGGLTSALYKLRLMVGCV